MVQKHCENCAIALSCNGSYSDTSTRADRQSASDVGTPSDLFWFFFRLSKIQLVCDGRTYTLFHRDARMCLIKDTKGERDR